MKKLISVVTAAGLLVGAVGCAGNGSAPTAEPTKSPSAAPTSAGPTSAKPTTKPSITGVVTARRSLRMVSPAPYCKQMPLPVECRSSWVLVVRSKNGKRHSPDVPEGTYKRYHLGNHYPARAEGGRS